MTNTNVDRLVEEIVEEVLAEFFDKFISPTIPGSLGAAHVEHIRLWLEKKLPTALSQARQEGREEIKRQLDRLIHDELPKHAEMNGYGCALDDVRGIINELTTEGK